MTTDEYKISALTSRSRMEAPFLIYNCGHIMRIKPPKKNKMKEYRILYYDFFVVPLRLYYDVIVVLLRKILLQNDLLC